MYAEYWNPMNWNSSTDSMNGKTVVEKMLLKEARCSRRDQARRLPGLGDVRRGDAARVLRQVGIEAAPVREQQAEHEHRDEARHAEAREHRHDPVERSGRQQGDDRDRQQHDDRGDEARGAR